MKRIVWEKPDGSVMITEPIIRDGETEDEALSRAETNCLAKNPDLFTDSVSSHVDLSSLPNDRTFRAAWRKSGASIIEDHDTCRALRASEILEAKKAALADLRGREDLGEDVTAARASLLAIDTETETAGKTPDELRNFWPAALRRRALAKAG